MITEQAASSIVASYAAEAGAIRFDGPVLDRGGYWFYPVGCIGSLGVVVDKETGRLTVLGSCHELEHWF